MRAQRLFLNIVMKNVKQGLYCICHNIRGLSDNRRPWKVAPLRTAARDFPLESKSKRTEPKPNEHSIIISTSMFRVHLSAEQLRSSERR